MPKRGLPATVKMRHDSHYIEELAQSSRTVGKILPIDKLEPNPDQPRVEFGDLSDLTASIKEQGVLEPILVKPLREQGIYLIIAGERRWRASNLAGLTEVPCIELDIDDKSIAEIAIVENLQRKDLTIWEVADGLADLSERYGYTHADIAKKIGKSRTTVTESMAIAGLPVDIRLRCQKANINSKATLIEISRQFDLDAMNNFLDEIESDGSKNLKNKNKKVANTKLKKQSKPIQDVLNDNSSIDSDDTNSFRFKSKLGNFEVFVKFNDLEFDDRDILRALKEAFDSVKAG